MVVVPPRTGILDSVSTVDGPSAGRHPSRAKRGSEPHLIVSYFVGGFSEVLGVEHQQMVRGWGALRAGSSRSNRSTYPFAKGTQLIMVARLARRT